MSEEVDKVPKKDREKKATARREAERAREETYKMIQRLQKEKDQSWRQPRKVMV